MTTVLNSRVLVLNGNWMPINVVPAVDAIGKVLHGRAKFVDPETYATYSWESWVDNWEDAIALARFAEERVLHSPSVGVLVPEVIVCTEYRGSGFSALSKRPKFSRRNIFARDRNTCMYCGKKHRTENLNLDHVIPKSHGGKMEWTNIVLACIKCNDKKRDRTPEAAGMTLIKKPRVPKPEDVRLPFGEKLKRKLGRNVPDTWESFLGKMYWSVELKD